MAVAPRCFEVRKREDTQKYFAYDVNQKQQKSYHFTSPRKTENTRNFTEQKPEPRYAITRRNSHQEFPWGFVV